MISACHACGQPQPGPHRPTCAAVRPGPPKGFVLTAKGARIYRRTTELERAVGEEAADRYIKIDEAEGEGAAEAYAERVLSEKGREKAPAPGGAPAIDHASREVGRRLARDLEEKSRGPKGGA